MKKFIKKIAVVFILPTLVCIIYVIIWDPFRIFFTYNDYYTNNRITGNREQICYDLFTRHQQDNKIGNFIIGSSRSLAFKTNHWADLISVNKNTCFHFDGASLGLFSTNKLIEFLTTHCEKISHILLIVDGDFLKEIKSPQGHLYVQPPPISGESKLNYYWKFISAGITPSFVLNNLIYKITGRYYDFMGPHMSDSKYSHKSNNETGDLYFSYDQDILNDSVGYYKKLIQKNVFYKRPLTQQYSDIVIKEKQALLLSEIKHNIMMHNISIKIIISPLYNQLKINEKDYFFLCQLFGKENVYDFSGINKYTENKLNYYENSHYKPYIADLLLKEVYR